MSIKQQVACEALSLHFYHLQLMLNMKLETALLVVLGAVTESQ